MNIPTINELRTQIESDIRTQFGITKTWVGKVFLKVLASVQAAKMKLLYLQAASVQKNIFVDTADSESTGGTLERFGRTKIGRDPYPAAAGVYTITVTGSAGGVIPAGTTFRSTTESTNPDKIYVVDIGVTLSGSTGTVTIRALTAGTSALLSIGDKVESTTPLSLVDSEAEIATVTTSAVDAEDIENYRALVLQAFQLEPQGGAPSDYRIWAADVSGVRTVYPYTRNGEPYSVDVFVEALPDDSEPGQPEGVPPASIISDVEDAIEADPDTGDGRRPMGVFDLEVKAVVPVAVTVTVNGLTDTSTATINAITTAIENLFYKVRPYIAGADTSKRNDTLYLYQISSAVYGAIGTDVSFTSVTMTIGGSIVDQYNFGNIPATYGNYPYLYLLETPLT